MCHLTSTNLYSLGWVTFCVDFQPPLLEILYVKETPETQHFVSNVPKNYIQKTLNVKRHYFRQIALVSS